MKLISDPIDRTASTDSKAAWMEPAGADLRYVLSGSGPAGAVMIHELGGSIESWDRVVAPLEATMQLLRYDQRGQGQSARVNAAFSLNDQLDDLRNLLDAIAWRRPCWLIAAAAGAAIAVSFAARFPDEVAGVILCAPALDVDPSRVQYLRERAELAVRDGMSAIVDVTLDNSWPPILRNDKAAYDEYRARFVTSDPTGYAFASRALSEIDLSAALGALACPCLVLAGEHDLQRPPERLAQQAARMTQTSFDVVPLAGHLMAAQQPAEVARRIVAFIGRTQV
ncbi:3-oxoadipate enol-lactonase [Paraburkholderia sp. GAS199]|uniref:alpha/beta fold hydrolase n=1 Tax=Paraburkholderia sp. GAS199 TaxID=3035126 RepID=UPI003D1E1DF4